MTGGAGKTDWPSVHKRALEKFSAGWDKPHPHAWDDFLTGDVELVQPMLRHGRGRELWWDEVGRLLAFLPDLHGKVLSWAGQGDTLFIELQLSATLGGKPITFRALDLLRLTPSGTVLRRDSFFDSVPLARIVLCRPACWLAWWPSGIGPFTGRRRLLGNGSATG